MQYHAPIKIMFIKISHIGEMVITEQHLVA